MTTRKCIDCNDHIQDPENWLDKDGRCVTCRDGGRAFPAVMSSDCYGMSLRDYYIGQALEGLCANPSLFDAQGQPIYDLPDQARHYANEAIRQGREATP